jgi:hypothetical protein
MAGRMILMLMACCKNAWETDFMKEIFPVERYHRMHVHEFKSRNDSSLQPRVLMYNVENSENDGSYSAIKALVKQHKIPVLVHTSDEFQGWPRKWKYGEGTEVYPLVM